MVVNKSNRQIEKTKKAIFEALSCLMQKKKMSQISVQEIIDYANIGRTTFYAHYPTKDDLMIDYTNNIFDNFHKNFSDKESKAKGMVIPVAAILEHLQENSFLIKSIFNSDNDELFFKRFKDYWNKELIQIINEKQKKGNSIIPPEIIANHISGSLIVLTKWWIKNDMKYSPKEMEEYSQILIFSVINSI